MSYNQVTKGIKAKGAIADLGANTDTEGHLVLVSDSTKGFKAKAGGSTIDDSVPLLASTTDASSFGILVDEDNMASDSAILVPSQQSVKAYVDSAVVGLFEDQGGYDAATNSPDLDTSPSGILKGDVYTVEVAGNFFATAVEVGNVLRALQDDPVDVGDWAVSGGFSAGDSAKLAAIEASADVTDATNVDAAGAVMESDVTAKGQIFVATGSGALTALAVGADDDILRADSSEASGVKWEAHTTDIGHSNAQGDWIGQPVQAISTSNINLVGGLVDGVTISGIARSTGALIALVGQTDSTENGFYPVVASGTAVRWTSADASSDFVQYKKIPFYNDGVYNSGTIIYTGASSPTLETDDLTFNIHYATDGVVGSRDYTNTNYISDYETIATSLDALDGQAKTNADTIAANAIAAVQLTKSSAVTADGATAILTDYTGLITGGCVVVTEADVGFTIKIGDASDDDVLTGQTTISCDTVGTIPLDIAAYYVSNATISVTGANLDTDVNVIVYLYNEKDLA